MCLNYVIGYLATFKGLAYLDVVHHVIMKKWELKQEKQEHFRKWLSMLVRLVDLTSEDAEKCITELLKSELQIVKMFSGYIKSEVRFSGIQIRLIQCTLEIVATCSDSQ